MATKKTKKSDLKYVPYDYNHEDLPGCCGVGVIYSLLEPTFKHNWDVYPARTEKIKPQFATREEQFSVFEQEVFNTLSGSFQSVGMISLIWKYADSEDYVAADRGKPQLPDLHEQLEKNGWRIEREWVAPRHGNTLRLYTKHFPEIDSMKSEDNDW